MRTFLLAVTVFVLSAGTAMARDGQDDMMEHGMPVPGMSSSTKHGREVEFRKMGSTTMGSTTKRGPGENAGKGKPPLQQMGIPGKVSSVGTNSFTIIRPGNKEHATSTITVNVTSATTYQRASSTATFADITAGAKVVVMGKVSTSTKSIAATKVVIAGEGMHKMEDKKGFFSKLKSLFFKKKTHDGAGDDNSSATTSGSSAAAVEGSGFMGAFVKSLLSLF